MNKHLEERLRFIDFILGTFGHFNRAHLMDYWGLSMPQVSLDIQKYIDLCPKNIQYDMSEKVYKRTANFKRKWK
jgi:hypothetical protein